jgi:hypothetical protein
MLLGAIPQAAIGAWGLLAPRSFYSNFPLAGHHWIAALGPYNEHLVRDYAAGALGFAVLFALAGIRFSRGLVLAASAASLAATLPHFAYHLTTTDHLSTTDNIGSLAALAAQIILVTVAMGLTASAERGRPGSSVTGRGAEIAVTAE